MDPQGKWVSTRPVNTCLLNHHCHGHWLQLSLNNSLRSLFSCLQLQVPVPLSASHTPLGSTQPMATKHQVQCDRILQNICDNLFLSSHQSCVCLWEQHMTFKSQEEDFIFYPAGGKCRTVRWLFDQRGSRRCPNCCWCEETTRLTALKGQLSLGNGTRESTRSAMNCELVAALLWVKPRQTVRHADRKR